MTEALVIVVVPEVGPLALTASALREARALGRSLFDQGRGSVETPAAPVASLLDAEALAEATGVPARWWMDQVREHRVPHRRIGKRVRFDLAEVMACDTVRRRGVNGSSIRNGGASD